MENTKQLEEEKIYKLLIKFSLPAIVGTLVNALYNIVDRIFIGNKVGDIGITGITVGFPITIIIMAFGMLIGAGATALISIKLGEKKKEDAERILGNAFVLLITIALINTILGITFLEPLLKLFGASDVALPYAMEYLSIILLGSVFMSVGFGMNNFIRAEGKPNIAMMTMLIGAITNTILDPIFIFGLNMGMKGAAIATIISQAVSAAWVLLHFTSRRSFLKIYIKNLKLSKKIILSIISIGVAPFAMQIAASLLNIILNNSLRFYGGDISIAALGIINSAMLIVMMPIIGITQGAQPIIGYNYGAKKYNRVKLTFIIAASSSTVITTISFILIMMFAPEIIRIFSKENQQLIELGAYSMRTFLLLLPVLGFQMVGAQYFQAVGKPKKAMVLTLSRQILFLIPLILILPKIFGYKGILLAGPISDGLAAIITGIWIFNEIQHLNQSHIEVTSV